MTPEQKAAVLEALEEYERAPNHWAERRRFCDACEEAGWDGKYPALVFAYRLKIEDLLRRLAEREPRLDSGFVERVRDDELLVNKLERDCAVMDGSDPDFAVTLDDMRLLLALIRQQAEDMRQERAHFNNMKNRAEAAEAQVAALKGSGWKPIETAPKDGTQLLLWQTSDICGGFATAGRFRGYIRGKPDWRGDSGNCQNPTHWQPLPSPPLTRRRAHSNAGADDAKTARVARLEAALRRIADGPTDDECSPSFLDLSEWAEVVARDALSEDGS